MSVETVQITIIKMVELVEQRIQKEIEKTIGAILFDGWSKRGVHYEDDDPDANAPSTEYEAPLPSTAQ